MGPREIVDERALMLDEFGEVEVNDDEEEEDDDGVGGAFLFPPPKILEIRFPKDIFLVADFTDSESALSDGVAGLDELLTLSCDIARRFSTESLFSSMAAPDKNRDRRLMSADSSSLSSVSDGVYCLDSLDLWAGWRQF